MKLLLLLFFTSCTHLFYHPSKIAYFNPKKFVDAVEDVWMKSKDGTVLNGWWMPSVQKKPKGTIIFFHGNAENLSSHFLNLAWITHEGYNLFIFDYRGYGASEGKPDSKGIYEDSFTALEKGWELHQKISPDKKFIIYGQSLGGVVSLRAIQEWNKAENIDLIVQDSTFLSYQNIAFDKLKSFWMTFIISPIAYILITDKFASYKLIKKVNQPLLVISGEKDVVVPHKFSEEIFQKASSKKKWFWKIPNGNHGDVFAYHDFKYRKEFVKLLDRL